MHASLGTVRGGNRDESFLGILCVDIRPLGGRDLKDAKSFDDVSCCHEDAFAHMKGAADALRAIGLLYSDVGHCPAQENIGSFCPLTSVFSPSMAVNPVSINSS